MAESGGGEKGESGGLSIRIRRGKNSGQGAGKKLIRKLYAATKKAGAKAQSAKQGGQFHRGRGAGVRLKLGTYAQMVTVKAKVVTARGGKGKAAMARHLKYIEREGKGKDGGKPVAFDQEHSLDSAELDQFVETSAGDRHSFRFIVSPENGAGLELEDYTRQLMGKMERDLGTRLEWVAAAHYDTDNPHVHVVVRGVDERGADLVIARDYIKDGMRERARDIATRELGRRSELDVARSLQRDLHEHRLTAVDRRLVMDAQRSEHGLVDLGAVPADPVKASRRSIKLQRLATLEKYGYAEKVVAGQWRIAPDLIERLQQAGRSGELAQVMAPHLAADKATESRHLDADTMTAAVRGIVVDRGVANELHGTEYVVIASPDGALNYAALSTHSDADRGRPARVGEYVELQPYQPPSAVLPSDLRVIDESKQTGQYNPAEHLAKLEDDPRAVERLPVSPEEFVEAHVRRCEALASRGHLERVEGGGYRVPADLAERITADESLSAKRRPFVRLIPKSRGRVDELTAAKGFTSLDEALVDGTATSLDRAARLGGKPLTVTQNRLRAAIIERQRQLVQMGVIEADSKGQPLAPPSDFRQRLAVIEAGDLAERLGPAHGRYLPLDQCRAMTGTVAGIYETTSGTRWAAVKGASGDFTLAPVGRRAPEPNQQVRVSIPRGQSLPDIGARRDFGKIRFSAPVSTRSRDRGLSR